MRFAAASLLLAILAGCTSPATTALETRIADLEAKLASLQTSHDTLVASIPPMTQPPVATPPASATLPREVTFDKITVGRVTITPAGIDVPGDLGETVLRSTGLAVVSDDHNAVHSAAGFQSIEAIASSYPPSR